MQVFKILIALEFVDKSTLNFMHMLLILNEVSVQYFKGLARIVPKTEV
jgi:hypothetical protein